MAVAALALAAAAGCSSSGSKPVALPSISSTTSASPTPSQVVPARAASAVVRRYFALKAHLAQDMNTAPFEAIETPQCPCRKFLTSIRETAAQGNHYFGTARIRSLTPAVDSAQQIEVLVQYDTSPGGTQSKSGRA